jgi:hypothetical protein
MDPQWKQTAHRGENAVVLAGVLVGRERATE